jgi:hypothetical protein
MEYLTVTWEASFMARRFTSIRSNPRSTDWALGAIPIVAVAGSETRRGVQTFGLKRRFV